LDLSLSANPEVLWFFKPNGHPATPRFGLGILTSLFLDRNASGLKTILACSQAKA
jgi:hypothetical protein